MSDTSAGPPAPEPAGSSSVAPEPQPVEPRSPRARPARSQPARERATSSEPPPGAQPGPDPGDPGGASAKGTGNGSVSRSTARRRRRRRAAGGADGNGGQASPDAAGRAGSSSDPASADSPQAARGAVSQVAGEAAPTAPNPGAGAPAAPSAGPAPASAPPRPRIGDTRPAPPPPRPVAPVVVPPIPRPAPAPAAGDLDDDEEALSATGSRSRSGRRSGRERRGRPVGRYLMCVHVRPHATQIAVLEGRTLVEHFVSRVADDTTQIDGNIYRGRVQNVLPGMEAAFVDIGTPKNAVLYRGDVRYDREDVESTAGASPRIEQMLRPGQTILCQVTKNPIGAKGARLTQEVSLPGRFLVMVPNSSAFGISKRLEDAERRRLRRIVDDLRPAGHGLIVRTAAEGASHEELAQDIARLSAQWEAIAAEAARGTAPGLLYREPDLAVRIVREELNREYRGVVIDDPGLFTQVRDYVADVNPELLDRVELYDPEAEQLPLFERFHVHEQLHKALDRKVWLPSGGSLIIERTEALTVIDVNTGKNVGKSNLEETVFRNNLEAAEEIARQLRLRDIGGIIVIDFIDMEIRENRDKVAAALRAALSRDKTRTQVFDISELGLVEMTRKRISEGLVEALSSICPMCEGRGIVLDETLL
jgi:ribonuclease E